MLSSQLLTSFLVIVAGMPLDYYLVGVTPFLQPGIIEFAAPIKHPLQLVGCSCICIDTILVGFDAHETRFFERGTETFPVPCCSRQLLFYKDALETLFLAH